ncbi:MAG: hypothetical protein A2Z47_03290 [Thermodesulfovibrio sp. RBG_19FT_COMBO_42_12]|nr:MAG: hypothetical protein A2Z47_03290 [Thermodesulfovibrio sp. RBG_19FT_COMBO_42_12]
MKNNPVLIGEAGVGKTAIMEALAIRTVQGKDPQVLAGKRIIELNMGALLGGTKYRGELKEHNSWQVVCSNKGISIKPQI